MFLRYRKRPESLLIAFESDCLRVATGRCVLTLIVVGYHMGKLKIEFVGITNK
jgi:hypothetical protein